MFLGMRLVSMARRAATSITLATAAATATSPGLRRYSSALVDPMSPRFGKLGTDGLPGSVNWRTHQAVTSPSYRGLCESCRSGTSIAVTAAAATATTTSQGLRRYSSASGLMCPRFGKLGTDGLPVSVDWRTQNAVTPPSNQWQCASCWAFASTASMEGANAIVTNRLVKLSEQQLVDCCTLSSTGCRGGWVNPTFQYIIENKGQVMYDAYPYEARQNVPHKEVTGSAVTIDSYSYSYSNTEQYLKWVVARQPVVVLVGADPSFMNYTKGVVDSYNYTIEYMLARGFAHYVTVVGYGEDVLGQLYWLVKNSHGQDYGQGGYIYIARETGKVGGAFGICRYIAYPIKRNGKNNPWCKVLSEEELKRFKWVRFA